MYKSLMNQLRYLRDTTSLSSLVIRLKYWWYTREQSRLLVVIILCCVLAGTGFLVQHSIEHRANLKQLNCLALNIYHEARGEPVAGQHAVAEVTLNRVASRHYPDSVCEVVYQSRWDKIRKRQVAAFSWTELERNIKPDNQAWHNARQIALAFFEDKIRPRLDGAIFFHAKHIRPSWAKKQTEVARIGRHIFYK